MLHKTYPGAESRFEQPAGFKDLGLVNKRGFYQRAGKLDHPQSRATIYMLHGQQESIECFYEFAHDLYEQKLSVRFIERVGEGGSQRLSANPQMPPDISHEYHLGDIVDFMTEVAPPDKDKPTLLVGNCIGGLLALQTLDRLPDIFNHAVLGSPLLGKQIKKKRDLIKQFAFTLPIYKLKGQQYVPGAHDWSWEDKQKRLADPATTHDLARYRNLISWPLHHPELCTGGYTYGNLYVMAQSILKVREQGFAERLQTPVTIMIATEDYVASISEQEKMAERLPHVKRVFLENARHNLFTEQDRWRHQMLAEIEETVCQYELKKPALSAFPALYAV